MKDYVCEKHGPYQGEPLEIFDTSLDASCPACEKELEDQRQRELDVLEEKKRLSFLTSCNIEPMYFNSTLDNFATETQEQATNKAKTKDLIDGKIMKLVMAGKNGTGKTHLAIAALKALGGKILTMYEISTTIRASYTAKSDQTELEIVDGLARLPLLVIDELGRTKGGDAEQNWLSYILDKRHVRKLPTILITNKHVRKACESDGCPDCLENYITEDVMSRLSENGIMAKFTGEDWRRRRVDQ